MVEGAGEQVGHGQEGRHQNYLFYAYDVMIASLDPGWLQGVFSILVGPFDRVSLKTNVRNTVEIFCRLFQVAVTRSEATYDHWMTDAGPSFQ